MRHNAAAGRSFLARHWFLPALAAGVLTAGLRPDWFAWALPLDPRLAVTPALFLMAWGLPGRRLGAALARPGPALWAAAVSYGLVPALGLLAGPLLPLADLRVGLLISCCVPCTLASAALWTRLAGGDEAVALLVTVLTTATSWLVTTAWLALATGAEAALDPAALMLDLLAALVVPVALGQLCRLAGPLARLADRRRAALGVASRLLILLIVVKAAAGVGARLRAEGAPPAGPLLASAAAAVLVHLTALAFAWGGGRLLGFGRAARVAVAFAGSQKTLPVALLLFERYYRADYPLAVVPLACYHFGQLVADTFIADRLARSSGLARPAEARGTDCET